MDRLPGFAVDSRQGPMSLRGLAPQSSVARRESAKGVVGDAARVARPESAKGVVGNAASVARPESAKGVVGTGCRAKG